MVVTLNIYALFEAIECLTYVLAFVELTALIFMIPEKTRFYAQILEITCFSIMLSMYMARFYVQIQIGECYVDSILIIVVATLSILIQAILATKKS